MGSSSTTIGYHYLLAFWHGLCKGPIDGLSEFRGGKKVAWSGAQTESGLISVNEPELWGGEEDQGGIVGGLRFMNGDADQVPNEYLVSVFGEEITAMRGLSTVVFEGGRYGAMNPYQQRASYLAWRITKGWDGDECWYEAKAPVPLFGSSEIIGGFAATSWSFPCLTDGDGGSCPTYGIISDSFTLTGDGSQVLTVTLRLFGSVETRRYVGGVVQPTATVMKGGLADVTVLPNHNRYELQISNPPQVFYPNHVDSPTSTRLLYSGETIEVQIASDATVTLYANSIDGNQDSPGQNLRAEVDAPAETAGRYAKNPAHMLVYAHTQQDCGRESIDTINAASAEAAADWYYAQGFGLGTARRPNAESPAEFIRRIEKVAACSFSRSMADGLYYIDIANGVYDFDSLPILTDDDVLDFKEIPTVLSDAINSVSVKYFDPWRNESIITPPIRAMGLVAQFGVIHQTYDYPEIPTGPIAVRVAQRELLASTTPTRAFDLATNRTPRNWRKNTYFCAQLAKRGIADMVCMVGDLQDGQLMSGGMKLTAVQDIYSLPSTVYTEVEHGVDPRRPQVPVAIVDQVAFEAPFVDVVAAMKAAEFAALDPDTGFVVAVAVDPGKSLDYSMYTAPSGGEYDRKGTGRFCPTAVVDGVLQPGVYTGIPIRDGVRLAEVVVGMAVLLGDEICRVDAIDIGAGTIDLGRGCADTVPASHADGTRLYFYADYAATDRTEYSAGETVDVKLLTNTGSKRLAQADATAMHVTLNQRLARPYPNANLTINGVPIFDVGTSGDGGGGGGGGGSVPTTPPPTGPTGSPASPVVGPNGGYPDNAPPLFPLPTVFGTDIIPAGDFSDPASLANWRTREGATLPASWTLLDDKLHFYGGTGDNFAYCYAARRSLPYMPFPRYAITVTADVTCDPSVQTRIGIAWGTWQSGQLPTYIEASAPASYPSETTVSHTFSYAVQSAAAGIGFPGQYPTLNVMPVVQHIVDGAVSNASVDNVTMVITEVTTATTAATPAHLDFDSGFTGWTFWPDPADTNPYVATMSVSGGEASANIISAYAPYRYLICDDPLTLADAVGKYVQINGQTWCDDPTTVNTPTGVFTTGGVTFGLAYKQLDGTYVPSPGGRLERGDWSDREVWQRVLIDAGSGITVHVCVLFNAAVGKTCKVRNLTVRVTDAVMD